MPMEHVRHSPTRSRIARLTFSAAIAGVGGLALFAQEAAGHFVDRPTLVDGDAGVDRRDDLVVEVEVGFVVAGHHDEAGAHPLCVGDAARAGLYAELLGLHTGGDDKRGVGDDGNDGDGFASKLGVELLLARCEEGVQIDIEDAQRHAEGYRTKSACASVWANEARRDPRPACL